MLVPNPPRINHRELRILAQQAKGSINKLYLHWTAGRYGQYFDDYHINIDSDGAIYQTCSKLTDLKAHTWKRNTRAVGITLCCAYGAVLNGKWQPIYPEFAPTELQINQMAAVIAILCYELGLEISFSDVKTHAEVAFIDGYGPGQDDPDMRWDLIVLPGLPQTKNLRPGGYLLRDKAMEFSKYLEYSKVVPMPQPAELPLDLAA